MTMSHSKAYSKNVKMLICKGHQSLLDGEMLRKRRSTVHNPFNNFRNKKFDNGSMENDFMTELEAMSPVFKESLEQERAKPVDSKQLNTSLESFLALK